MKVLKNCSVVKAAVLCLGLLSLAELSFAYDFSALSRVWSARPETLEELRKKIGIAAVD